MCRPFEIISETKCRSDADTKHEMRVLQELKTRGLSQRLKAAAGDGGWGNPSVTRLGKGSLRGAAQRPLGARVKRRSNLMPLPFRQR